MSTEKRLGKGLSALFGEQTTTESSPQIAPSAGVDSTPQAASPPRLQILEVALEAIQPSRVQPRQNFDDAALSEMAQSIKRDGVLQPLLVRTADFGRYELIAGERRWRAAKLANIEKIPVIVIDRVDDKQQLILALVENIHRADLNAIEKARAFKLLMERTQVSTQEQLAESIGLDRTTVTNILRLLELAPDVQDAVSLGLITPSHARILAGVAEHSKQRTILAEIVSKELSVKQLGQRVQSLLKRGVWKTKMSRRHEGEKDAQMGELESVLSHVLGTKVRITKDKAGRGKVVINYYSDKQLDEILHKIGLYNV